MTREQMIDKAVLKSMSKRSMRTVLRDASLGVKNPFRLFPGRFIAIIDHFAGAVRKAEKRRVAEIEGSLGMSIAEAREKFTPGPMRYGEPDMSKWEHGVHAHPSLWPGWKQPPARKKRRLPRLTQKMLYDKAGLYRPQATSLALSFKSWKQLIESTRGDLLKIDGIGPRTVWRLEYYLSSFGRKLAVAHA
jgi:hypothetical protein